MLKVFMCVINKTKTKKDPSISKWFTRVLLLCDLYIGFIISIGYSTVQPTSMNSNLCYFRTINDKHYFLSPSLYSFAITLSSTHTVNSRCYYNLDMSNQFINQRFNTINGRCCCNKTLDELYWNLVEFQYRKR